VAEPKKPERRTPSNPFVTGPTRILDVTQPNASPVRRGASETTRPVPRTDLVTDGMKAHRREIERRKRAAAIEKMTIDQQAAETRRKIWKWTFWVVILLVGAFAYRSLQDSYGNQWPIFHVWVVLGTSLFAAIGWLVWYLNRPDM